MKTNSKHDLPDNYRSNRRKSNVYQNLLKFTENSYIGYDPGKVKGIYQNIDDDSKDQNSESDSIDQNIDIGIDDHRLDQLNIHQNRLDKYKIRHKEIDQFEIDDKISQEIRDKLFLDNDLNDGIV